MLELEEPEDGQRRRYFRRTSSPLWAVISATADALEALKPEEEAQPAPVARRSKATIAVVVSGRARGSFCSGGRLPMPTVGPLT